MMKEQGSIIGYVVVGTVLTLALVGGVLVVKAQHNSIVQQQVASNTSSDSNKSTSADKIDKDKKANDTLTNTLNQSNKSTNTNASNKDSDKNKTTPTPSAQSTTSTNTSSATTPSKNTTTTPTTTPTTGYSGQPVTALPETGPVEGVVAVVAVGSLVGAMLAYRKSHMPTV